jgi:predicted transcriptional regulator of viral defense system
MASTHAQRILELLASQGMLRPRDLDAAGIARQQLSRLVAQGDVLRVARGIYIAADADLSAHHSLAEACKRVPSGVICLLSALAFHEIGTQGPHEVWMAIDFKARLPRAGYSPIHFVRFSGPALAEGVTEQLIEGVTVRVYDPAKTVIDCFRYRNKIGLDVALEALRDCRRQRKCSNDDLWRYAQLCHVSKAIRPYLEAAT